ncbi:MAG: flavin reductase family protein [Bacteroidetes bacterium]|nr:flavin reductase family protein [Bacteroidota bacterium]
MYKINPSELPISKLQQYLQGAVAPRPIALASTINANGKRNLAPFSFYNIFSSNPPVLVFSPARSGRTAKQKHTFNNIKETSEVVINAVNYEMLHQMNLASSEFEDDIDEFEKSGFTPVKSELVKPFRVKESPVQFECEVKQIIELGTNGGAGNLIICEIKLIHISENILNENNEIDQNKVDFIARMGGNWYCRTNSNSMFEVKKPLASIGIGVDSLPDSIKFSKILTGNQLGLLASIDKLPAKEEIEDVKKLYENFSEKEKLATLLLEKGEIKNALCVLM